jgi:chemotaxis protein MotB
MSESENHHHGRNEVIIVKRHGGEEHEGGHGGAWKIAYADFMTAMMAFFLVMWLVNAANEETKASVATYFNPIKLADEKPTEKGLKKPVDQADGEEKQEKSKEKEDQPTTGASAANGDDQTSSSGDKTNYSEANFFENPYSVLAEIAQEVGQQANVSVKGEGGASDSGPATGADGGQAYRDPFDPDFWTKQVEVSQDDKAAQAAADQADPNPKPDATELAKAQAVTASADQAATAADAPQDKAPNKSAALSPGKPGAAAAGGPTSGPQTAADAQKQAAELQQEIAKQINGVAGKLAEGLTVTPAEGGLLVSLSDQSDSSMFNVGSAVPRKEMVLAMEKIGEILKGRPGAVVIRGHTDGRQYKGNDNANWRLSTDRAQAAYYMLVRGGLDEKRVSQVSGFADRKLKLPDDPFNAANRRIEILVQAGQG